MKPEIIIADDRPVWMQKEDVWSVCWIRCPLYEQCSTRMGMECKHMGGTKIPKLRGKQKWTKGKKRNSRQ